MQGALMTRTARRLLTLALIVILLAVPMILLVWPLR